MSVSDILQIYYNFPTSQTGVVQKTTFSIDSSANSLGGVSRALMEHIGSGIGFITILPMFRHHFPGIFTKIYFSLKLLGLKTAYN